MDKGGEMIQCAKCKGFFNPALLSEVFEHEHSGLQIDKEYFGKEVVKSCGNCVKREGCKIDNVYVCFNWTDQKDN